MIQDFWLFALTGLLLNLTPGNDMIYVIARTTSQGRKAGVVSALGIGAGCMVHILAAVGGLSALVAHSVTAFNTIKLLGAAYLIYLGVRSIISANKTVTESNQLQSLSYKKIFLQGALTNVLNPKVALFFLAFLPQFIDAEAANAWWQILLLGTWFDVVGTLVNVLVAVLVSYAGKYLFRSQRWLAWQQRITGFILIALGIKLGMDLKK